MKNGTKIGMAFLIMTTMLLLSIGAALAENANDYANRTMMAPAASEVVAGTYLFNVSFIATRLFNVTNVTWSATDDLGNNLGVIGRNDTTGAGYDGNASTFSKKIVTGTNLNDGRRYTITTTYRTDQKNADNSTNTTTNVGVGNTAPICTITSPTTGSTIAPKFTVNITATNASSCTVVLNGKWYNTTYTGTQAGANTCTTTLNNILAEGQYTFNAFTEDNGGTKTTCTGITNVVIDDSMPAVRGAVIDADQAGIDFATGQSKNKTITTIIILGAAAWLIFSKSSPLARKRR